MHVNHRLPRKLSPEEERENDNALGMFLVGLPLAFYACLALATWIIFVDTHDPVYVAAGKRTTHEEDVRNVSRTWFVSVVIGLPYMLGVTCIPTPFRNGARMLFTVWGPIIVAVSLAVVFCIFVFYKTVMFSMYVIP